MITWLQIGLHEKPIVLFNINGYYDHLLQFFDHCVSEVRATGVACVFAGCCVLQILMQYPARRLYTGVCATDQSRHCH